MYILHIDLSKEAIYVIYVIQTNASSWKETNTSWWLNHPFEKH